MAHPPLPAGSLTYQFSTSWPEMSKALIGKSFIFQWWQYNNRTKSCVALPPCLFNAILLITIYTTVRSKLIHCCRKRRKPVRNWKAACGTRLKLLLYSDLLLLQSRCCWGHWYSLLWNKYSMSCLNKHTQLAQPKHLVGYANVTIWCTT